MSKHPHNLEIQLVGLSDQDYNYSILSRLFATNSNNQYDISIVGQPEIEAVDYNGEDGYQILLTVENSGIWESENHSRKEIWKHYSNLINLFYRRSNEEFTFAIIIDDIQQLEVDDYQESFDDIYIDEVNLIFDPYPDYFYGPEVLIIDTGVVYDDDYYYYD